MRPSSSGARDARPEDPAKAATLTAASYDEAKVGDYTLPDPLTAADGTRVADAGAWFAHRRPEILRLFEEHIFGRMPLTPPQIEVTIAEEAMALSGAALRREATISFGKGAPKLNLLVYRPREANGPVPVMLGPNYLGNHSVHTDPGIALPDISFVGGMDVALAEGRATEASRGRHSSRWPIERILERGYAVATFHYGDLFPDRADGRALGIQPSFGADYTWGALAIWAYAMSRALDAIEGMPDLDASRVALVGHSRHGKAALWAGALDARFAIVVANNSGKGGASLARRNFGETILDLVTRFPHWFAAPYAGYAGREADLPIDQHMLIALNAPRPVYVASASEDLWADPKGEFLGALNASPVYRLLGTDGLAADRMPAPGRSILSTIGYHLRPGRHDITLWDWERFLDFSDKHLARRQF